VSLSYALLGSTRLRLSRRSDRTKKGSDSPPSKVDFSLSPSLGGSFLKTTSKLALNTRLIEVSSRDTVIGAGSRLDNLVQIGHNVLIGRCCVIVAQVGISGSTVT